MQVDEANCAYQEALQADARLVDAHIDLGSLSFQQGQVAEAKRPFSEGV